MKKLLKLTCNLIPSTIKNRIGQVRKQLRNFNILARNYGQFRSIREWSCLDSSGRPIPWYTYPAIEYLNHLDFSQMNLFEFGSGNSTLWWAGKTKSVTSIEDDENWYSKVYSSASFLPDKIKYLHENNKEMYVNAIAEYLFDIVVIDGKHRTECANHMLSYYKNREGVMLIFDNSDWYPETINILREGLGLVQVDFHGFGPINDYTWTTTIFINQANQSRLKYLSPLKSIAGTGINAEIQ